MPILFMPFKTLSLFQSTKDSLLNLKLVCCPPYSTRIPSKVVFFLICQGHENNKRLSL